MDDADEELFEWFGALDEIGLPTVIEHGGKHHKVTYHDPRLEARIWATQTTIHPGTGREAISLVCNLHPNCRPTCKRPHDFKGIEAVRRWVREGVDILANLDGRRRHVASYNSLGRIAL